MPISSPDGKFIHCSFCNEKFRFGYDASKHERENHAAQMQSSSL